MVIFHLIVLAVSFYLLAIITDEFFIESLDRIAKRLRLGSEAAGATLMAVGSSAPEFFTSLFAVLRPGGFADIGAGTIVGSAIFNILVIVGVSAMFRRAELTWQVALRDLFFYIFSIILLLVTFWDGRIAFVEALLFLIIYGGYIVAVSKWNEWFSYHDQTVQIVEKEVSIHPINSAVSKALALVIPDPKGGKNRYFATFIASVLGIAVLSYALVESAVWIGGALNISTAAIALTVLAAGTSIPDLFSSVIVARQGRGDMAVANAVGSNIFDILFGLGFPWMLYLILHGGYVPVATENLLSSVFLLFATVVAILFILIVRRWRIGRRAGIVLVFLYFAYLLFNINELTGLLTLKLLY